MRRFIIVRSGRRPALLGILVVALVGVAGLSSTSPAVAGQGASASVQHATSTAASSRWTPALIDNPRGDLTSVSCPTGGLCMAVDAFGNAVAETAGGWARPVRVGLLSLVSVSCPAATFCVAVGVGPIGQGMASTFNGVAWSLPTIVQPNTNFPVNAVSCASSTFCVVTDFEGEVITFNGTSWSAPKVVDLAGFTSISCPTSTFCAGSDRQGGIARFSAGTWSVTKSVLGSDAASSRVSCATPTFCVATDGVLSAAFDGHAWVRSALGFAPSLARVALSCPVAGFCVLAESRAPATWGTTDGRTWHPLASSSLASNVGITCSSRTRCMAIGGTGVTDAGPGLAAGFDGSTWSSATVADAFDSGRLRQVSCPSATRCIAVDDSGYFVVMTGSTWSYPQPIPLGRGGISAFGWIDCPTTTFCMGIGGGYARTLKGSTWSPARHVTNRSLSAVSCASAKMCLAVDDLFEAFTYNGSTWSKLTGTPAGLGGGPVECASPTECFAAVQNGQPAALARYDGHSWTTTTVHSEPDSASLADISCTTPTECTAIGRTGGAAQLIGSTWKESIPFDAANGPKAISCVATAVCQVVDTEGQILSLVNGKGGVPVKVEGWNGVLSDISCATKTFCAAVDWEGLVFTGP